MSSAPISFPAVFREIGPTFDGNQDGVLSGPEFWALLRELSRRSPTIETPGSVPIGSTGSVLGSTPAMGSGRDQIDPTTVNWLHEDVSQWAVTSQVTYAGVDPDSITIEHTKAGQWPQFELGGDTVIEGNPWVIVYRDGQWQAATYEWLRPGQTTKGVTAETLGPNTKREPLASWQPRPGELVGFMVSTPARDGSRTIQERSNIQLVRWPGDSAPASSGVPQAGMPDPLRHNTDFLTLRAADGRTLFTHEYAGYSDAQRAEVRRALKERGYTHIYLYAMNEGDYGGRTVFNWYRDPAGFRQILQELVDDGLAPVVWLAPDDAPNFHRDSAEVLPELWRSFIPAIDDLASSYVVGLEMDEYWSGSEQNDLGRHLNTLTEKPLFVHYRTGEWEGARAPWVDGIVYQYGSGVTEAEVRAQTRDLISELSPLGKTFIAGEYAYRVEEAYARRLGEAALEAGADGTGNGSMRG